MSKHRRATYGIGETIEVYTIFDGWQECKVVKLGWDHVYGRVQHYVMLTSDPNCMWITSASYIRPVVRQEEAAP